MNTADMTPQEAAELFHEMRTRWPGFAPGAEDSWLGRLVRLPYAVALAAFRALAPQAAPPSVEEWQRACRDAFDHVRPETGDPAPTRLTREKYEAHVNRARQRLHETPSPFIPKAPQERAK